MIPEKWCIRNSPEIRELFKTWLPSEFEDYYTSSTWTFFNYPNFENAKGFKDGYHTGSDDRYTEITIEEFKQYVLRQTSEYEIY